MIKINVEGYELSLLSRSAISDEKWDCCVQNSGNESPMAYTWVLDIIHPEWVGIVVEDYKGVMPLTSTNVMGSKHLQMPYDIQNYGIFSSSTPIVLLFEKVCKELTKYYKLIAYSSVAISNFDFNSSFCKRRCTYLLSLNKDYSDLRAAYSHGHKRNVNRFNRFDLEVLINEDPNQLLRLKEEMWQGREFLRVPRKHHIRLSRLIHSSISRSCGELYTATHEGEPVSSAFFLSGKKRSVIIHASNDTGKKYKCSFGLVDLFIKSHSGEDKFLDFAGSDVKGIAEFNGGFGATANYYPMFEHQELSRLLKMLKNWRLKHRFQYLFNLQR
ncbi:MULTISPECIES: hypothetical protein [unclassified Carboxylicivirga]|uniref:hypothetical protein n=1 Tax=Carboxylicivirga TaxID=1628153 RepID=UPI003D34285C